MKIRINEKEVYEFDFDNSQEITLQDLNFFIERFHKIAKVFSNDLPINNIKEKINKNYNSGRKRYNKITRDMAIEMIRIYYDKEISRDKKLKILSNKYGIAVNDSRASIKISYLKNKFKIKPSEISMSNFPNLYKE